MIVTVDHAQRDWRDDLFADITTKRVIDHGEDGQGRFYVQFEVNLTTAEQDAVTLRLGTASAVEEQIQATARDALTDLRTIREFTGTATNAQLTFAVKTLARVMIGLVRVLLRRYDAAD